MRETGVYISRTPLTCPPHLTCESELARPYGTHLQVNLTRTSMFNGLRESELGISTRPLLEGLRVRSSSRPHNYFP